VTAASVISATKRGARRRTLVVGPERVEELLADSVVEGVPAGVNL
jgi:hypothetical protein